tara:strand:+ start:601 stop:2433 length:1833 start_codon:yes stop_codon:yes gene_type:complete
MKNSKGFGENTQSSKNDKIFFRHNQTKEEIIEKAFYYHQKGNIIEASKYYRIFINHGFSDPRVFCNYGLICKQLGKSNEAIELYRKSLNLYPRSPETLSNLGNLLHHNGEYDEAEMLLKQSIKLNPNFAEAYSNLGSLLIDKKNLNSAELYLLKAINLNPNFMFAYYNLGSLFIELGDFEKAKLYLEQAIRLNPKFIEAYINLGSSLINLGSYREAELYLRKAIKLSPQSVEALSNLGSALTYIGNFKESKKYLYKVLKINPNFCKSYYILSTFYSVSEGEKYERKLFSKELLNKIDETNSIDIYYARGNILDRKKDYTKSSLMFKKANELNLKIYPSNYSQIINEIDNYLKPFEKDKHISIEKENTILPIFIVGMPRSGKTLIETILASNDRLLKCGETVALKKAIHSYYNNEKPKNNSLQSLFFDELKNKIKDKSFLSITTPSNFLYSKLIINYFTNSRIIYCFRNPLDNIKELYIKNLREQYPFSSSIKDSTNLWLLIHKMMNNYKKEFPDKVYSFNYDDLVNQPVNEIKSLITWLGWEFKSNYLNPNLDPTTLFNVNSNDMVINNKYLNSWKNYEEMLSPAIDILRNEESLGELTLNSDSINLNNN